jgi:hypothetical protein
MKQLAPLASVLLLSGTLAACITSSDQGGNGPKAKTYTVPRPLTAAEKKIVQTGLSSSLKDPDSIQIHWTPYRASEAADDAVDYCGTLNAKNSFGGYIGFKPFFANVMTKQNKIQTAVLIGTSDKDYGRFIEDPVITLCKQNGLDPFAAE